MKFIQYLFYLLLLCTFPFSSQPQCTVYPVNFNPEEKLTYIVSYNWFVIWAEVGEVTFSVHQSSLGNQTVYHLLGLGNTYSGWDIFFKVRDRYESWADRNTLKPYYFKRMVREGGYEIDIRYIFNRDRKYARSSYIVNRKPEVKDTIQVTDCTFDLVSAIYYARTIDYSACSPGDTIPLKILLDRQLENISIRYLGKEIIKVRKVGEFECLKLAVSLVSGTVFKGGEEMMVWITNDRNKLPVYAESPIIVGSVKVKLSSFENIRYPFTSKN